MKTERSRPEQRRRREKGVVVGRAIRRPLTISAAALLLAAVASTPLHGGTTAITLNLSGTSSSSNTPTGSDYVLNGSGPVMPFGMATFTGSGTVTATSSSAGTVSGSLIVTFGNGDSFQADTPGQFAFDSMGNPTATVTAKITGGTGTFNNASGSYRKRARGSIGLAPDVREKTHRSTHGTPWYSPPER